MFSNFFVLHSFPDSSCNPALLFCISPPVHLIMQTNNKKIYLTVYDCSNNLIVYVPSTSSHFFSFSSAIFCSSSSCLLAAYPSKSLVLYTTYLLSPTCLFALLVSFYKTLISPVSSDPFPLHLSVSLFMSPFTALAFFYFLSLPAHHKCFL